MRAFLLVLLSCGLMFLGGCGGGGGSSTPAASGTTPVAFDVAGTWQFDVTFDSNPVIGNITQNGNSLVLILNNSPNDQDTGSINGTEIVFTIGAHDNNSNPITVTLTGTILNDDTIINGTAVSGGQDFGTWSATKTSVNADISGFWEFQPTGAGSMDLTQSGTAVTGTLSFGTPPTISGNVTGNDVNLLFTDGGCVNKLTGTVSGNTMSGNVTLTIDTSLGSCNDIPGTEPWSAIRTTSSSTTFSTADLNGTWSSHGLLAADSNHSQWFHSDVTVNNGNFTESSYQDALNSDSAISGILQLSSSGSLSIPSDPSVAGLMNKSKNLVAFTDGTTSNQGALTILLKKGGTFATHDLAGTWNWEGLTTGDGVDTNLWQYGTFIVNTSGTVTHTSTTRSNGDSGVPDPETLVVAADGTVTSTANPSFNGILSSDKKVLVLTMSDFSMDNLCIAVKAGATYAQSDLTGTWMWHALGAEDGNNFWAYGNSTIDQTGNQTFEAFTTSFGTATFDSGLVTLTSDGIIADASDSSVHGVMSANKDIAIVTLNSSSSLIPSLFVGVKR